MLDQSQWAQLLAGFLNEAGDLIEQSESALLLLDRGQADDDAIHRLFRAVHTLKGSAGLFALDGIVNFAHRMESRIMRARDSGQSLEAALIGDLLAALDVIRDEVARIAAGQAGGDIDVVHAALLERIEQDSGRTAQALAPVAKLSSGRWHVSVRFHEDLFCSGMDPAPLVRFMGTLGELVSVAVITDALPGWDAFDPERCYLGLELTLVSDAGREAIEDVFGFLADTASVQVIEPSAKPDDYLALIDALPEDNRKLGQILVNAGLLLQDDLDLALAEQQRLRGEGIERRLGEVLVAARLVPPEVVDAALRRQDATVDAGVPGASGAPRNSGMLKVSAQKMDELINLVGELVTAAAGGESRARRSNHAEFIEAAGEINRHVERIREVALRLRMVEIGETFNRFQRLVRDVGTQLGKGITLTIEGSETELDKTLVDRIGDPLTHLVRNAIDHGIEPADERRAAGKPEQGQLRLSARHEAGSVVIEVRDDGRGLDPERIRAKAVSRGLIGADDPLSTEALHQLIFAPGFSTAESVSNLSGRGVGMDVVKRAVESLRGSIVIRSELGHGCCFSIRLPLTLAIIDGFLIEIAGTTLVLPLGMVTECFEAPRSASGVPASICDLRGKPLPLLPLRDVLGVRGELPRRQNVVVVDTGRERLGLLVDHLLGEQQIVIKPLGALFQNLHCVSGSTILGSGEVALILDIARLAESVGHTPLLLAA